MSKRNNKPVHDAGSVWGNKRVFGREGESVRRRSVSFMDDETGDGEGHRRPQHHQNLPSLSHFFNSFTLNNCINDHKTLIILIPIPNY